MISGDAETGGSRIDVWLWSGKFNNSGSSVQRKTYQKKVESHECFSSATTREYINTAVEVAFLWSEHAVGTNKTRKVSPASKTQHKLAL